MTPTDQVTRTGTMNNPLPTLEWPNDNPPASWWGIGPQGLTKVYRSYEDYCDD